MQTPLLGFVLMNVGMGALLLDLTHRLYVWRVYTTFQVTSPMSWGSWVLIIVYGVLLAVGADPPARRLAVARPAACRRCSALSDAHRRAGRRWMRALGWANIVLGVGLGIYTGILLNTMVARPLWNSAILGPAVPVLGPVGRRGDDAPRDRRCCRAARRRRAWSAARFAAMLQPLGPQPPGQADRRLADPLRPGLPRRSSWC